MTVVTPTAQAARHAASVRVQTTTPITWTVCSRRIEPRPDVEALDARRDAGDDVTPDLAPLLTLVSDETGIDVARKLDGAGYVVAWTDYVANEWVETHATLALAFARVAVLQRCAESGWERGFAQVDAEAFAPVATYFLDGATTT